MNEQPGLDFEQLSLGHDEFESRLAPYVADLERYPHDLPSICSVQQAIRSGRMGNVAVGGCILHGDEVTLEDVSGALSPYHRTDLQVEMVLLDVLEDRLPPGFHGLGSRLIVEEASCAPELEELSRQVLLNSIAPSVQPFLGRH